MGVKRKYQELAPEYRDMFNKYHLEMPYYYAREGRNNVTITTVDYNRMPLRFDSGFVECQTEEDYKKEGRKFDVIVHWRKWFPELYKPDTLNVIMSQDHSFGAEWKQDVKQAVNLNQLYGILCFPTWHKRNMQNETGIPEERLLTGVTFGVDTEIYKPATVKDPYHMLWASDPGRGLESAIDLTLRLFQKDKRFRLNICYPDYVKHPRHIQHPSLIWHGCVQNGQKLWDLFNMCGVLPYTSSFMEPSSRAHRQAQAAGSLVLYPPNMGSPSELIENGVTGIVAPITSWPDRIFDLIKSGEWERIGKQSREFAVSQNWQVQADNFNALINKILQEMK